MSHEGNDHLAELKHEDSVESIDLTPDWRGMFIYTINIVNHSKLPSKALIIEMLQYGLRLHNHYEGERNDS
tara:strand:+ start:388 stop:600 length:213 start_codon:yes stop_codon:yes gene_type:complete